MGKALRAVRRLALYLAWTLLLLPLQVAGVALNSKLAVRLPLFYHRGCLRILGLKIATHGTMARTGPVLFVANHTSYLDIAALGAVIPGSFVAKREIARWPFFGELAKLQRTVFVDRELRRHVADQRASMQRRLEQGDNLILFPEGTSNDGLRVLPFKSALFGAAEIAIGGRLPVVQPVTIAYTRLDGLPMGRALRPNFAWYGEMTLLPHLWNLLGQGEAMVEIEFHEPVSMAQFATRRALADHCHMMVSRGLSRALAGRGGGGEQAGPVRMGEESVPEGSRP